MPTVKRVYSGLHYIMTMRKSLLWGSHGNSNEEYNLQGCNMVHFRDSMAFKRDVSPPSSGSSKIPAEAGNKLNSVCIMFLQHVRLSLVLQKQASKCSSACHLPWRWQCYAPPKCQAPYNLHGITTSSVRKGFTLTHWLSDIYQHLVGIPHINPDNGDTACYWNIGFLHNSDMAECLTVVLPIFVSRSHNFILSCFFF
jgi:hypothetical protein